MSAPAPCASCQGRDLPARVLCHHCGRPLCDDRARCRFDLPDPAFAPARARPGAPPEPTAVHAVHCRACWQRHHPRLRPLEPLGGRPG